MPEFNVQLLPRFLFLVGTQEEKDRQLEEYLFRMGNAIEETFLRLFGRASERADTPTDGNIATLNEDGQIEDGGIAKTALLLTSVLDTDGTLAANSDSKVATQKATKTYADTKATVASVLWEVDGTETQLKTADEIDMQTKKIINTLDPTADQDVATKKYHDDNLPSATNVLFSYCLAPDGGGGVAGATPDGGTTWYNLVWGLTQTQGGNNYATRGKFKKIAGVNTITFYAHFRRITTGSTAQVTLEVNSALTVTLNSTSQTPAWYSDTLDVSSLTDGTTYSCDTYMTNSGAAGVLVGAMIGIGS